MFARAKLRGPWPRMQHVWADGGYAGKLIAWVFGLCQWVLEIDRLLPPARRPTAYR